MIGAAREHNHVCLDADFHLASKACMSSACGNYEESDIADQSKEKHLEGKTLEFLLKKSIHPECIANLTPSNPRVESRASLIRLHHLFASKFAAL